jgi:hypothetical protein
LPVNFIADCISDARYPQICELKVNSFIGVGFYWGCS